MAKKKGIQIKPRSAWPWSFLWRNTKAYYHFYSQPIGTLTEGQAGKAVKKIAANARKLAAQGIEVHKQARKRGAGASEFKV